MKRTMMLAAIAATIAALPANAQRSRETHVTREPGHVRTETRIETRNGRTASASRDMRWEDGQYRGERSVTLPDGRTATRETSATHGPAGTRYTVHREGPNGGSTTVRGWRAAPPPGYVGVRRGYFFAPGYGYYPVPRTYWGVRWNVGVVVPVPLRRYYVVEPAVYGLAVAPRGYLWIHLDSRAALVSVDTGVIVRISPPLW